jgi:hypothetical protein
MVLVADVSDDQKGLGSVLAISSNVLAGNKASPAAAIQPVRSIPSSLSPSRMNRSCMPLLQLYDWILVLQLLLIGLSRSLYMLGSFKACHVDTHTQFNHHPHVTITNHIGPNHQPLLACSNCIAIYLDYIFKFKCSYSMVVLQLSCSDAESLKQQKIIIKFPL